VNNYHKYEEKELLFLMSQHDQSAFTELYERFWKKLFVIAFNRIKDRQSAEDAVHDVFVSLWANRDLINIDQLENYLAVAIRYSVLSKLRKKSREENFKRSAGLATIIDLSPETVLHHKQLLERIKREVEHLPERCRLIFNYSREAGMPVKEIAREMNISPKTVENQLTRAIRHLKIATRSFLQSFLTLTL
jgi:RNA polymerase sigma-70 factor (family 1)